MPTYLPFSFQWDTRTIHAVMVWISLPGPYVDYLVTSWGYYFRISGIVRKWGLVGGSRLPGAWIWRFCHVPNPNLSVSIFHMLLQPWCCHLIIGPESAESKYLQWNPWHSDPKLTIPLLHCSYGILVTVIRKQTNTPTYYSFLWPHLAWSHTLGYFKTRTQGWQDDTIGKVPAM